MEIELFPTLMKNKIFRNSTPEASEKQEQEIGL